MFCKCCVHTFRLVLKKNLNISMFFFAKVGFYDYGLFRFEKQLLCSLMHLVCLWFLQDQQSAVEDLIPCVSLCFFIIIYFIPCVSVIPLHLVFRNKFKQNKKDFFQVWTSMGVNQCHCSILYHMQNKIHM